MIDSNNVTYIHARWFLVITIIFGAILGYGIVFQEDPRVFTTISLLVILIYLGITSPKNLLLFLILLMPFQRFLGQYSSPIFENTGFFLELRSIVNVFVIFYTIFLVYFRRDRIGALKNYSVAVPLVIYIFIIFISAFYSPESFYSLRAFFRLGMPFFCYFLGLIIVDDLNDIEKIFKIALAASIVQLILGLTDPFLLPELESEPYIRSKATLGHPNNFAAYLAMCFYLFTFLKAIENKKLWSSFNSIIFTGTLFINFVLTIARSSWIALLVSIIATRRLFKLSIMSLIMILLLLAGLILAGPLWQRIEWRVVEERSNVYGRVNLNEYGFFLFKQSPIIGHGNSAYALYSRKHFGAKFAQIDIDGLGVTVGSNPHNEYMDILVGRGIIGIISLLWVLISVLKLSRYLSSFKDIWIANYGFMLMGLTTFAFVLAFFDAGFDYTGIWLWSFIGMGDWLYKKLKFENIDHLMK